MRGLAISPRSKRPMWSRCEPTFSASSSRLMNRRSLRALSFAPSIFTAAIVGISLPPARRLYDTLIVAHNADKNQQIALHMSYKCLIMVATDKDEAPAPTKANRDLQTKGSAPNGHREV